MTKTYLFFIILILSSLLCISNASAATAKSEEGGFKISYPDIVNPFEPFTVHVEVKDKNLRKATQIQIMYGSIPLSEGESFLPKSDLSLLENSIYYAYSGEKSFDIEVSLLHTGGFGLNDMYLGYKKTSDLDTDFTIVIRNENSDVYDSVIAPIKSYEYDITLDLSEEYIYREHEDDLSKLRKEFWTKDSHKRVNVQMRQPFDFDESGNNAVRINKIDLEFGRPTITHWMSTDFSDDHIKNDFIINGYPAVLYSRCSVSCFKDAHDKECKGRCNFIGQQATNLGIISFKMNIESPSYVEKSIAQAQIAEYEIEGNNVFRSISFSAKGSTKQNVVLTEDDEESIDCSVDSDCEAGFRCTACGECYEDAIDPSKVTVDFKMNYDISSKEMKNTIHSLIDIQVQPKSIFRDSQGKKIDYCEIAQPGVTNYQLVGKFLDEPKDQYSGFTILGKLLDEREDEFIYNIDFKNSKHKYTFHISPNDKKKIIGELGDEDEMFTISVKKDDSVINKKEFLIMLIEPKIEVDFKTRGLQVQDGHTKTIDMKISGKDAKYFMIEAFANGPGNIFKGEKGVGNAQHALDVSTKKAHFNSKEGEWTSFGFSAPKMSNTDFSELLKDAKTLDEAYLDAGKSIAKDVAFIAAGEVADKLVGASTKALSAHQGASQSARAAWGKYFLQNPKLYSGEKAAKLIMQQSARGNTLKSIYKMTKAVQHTARAVDATCNLPKNLDAITVRKDFIKTTPPDHHTDPNWKESAANTGVAIIDFTQAAVGVLTIMPSKIPVLGSLSTAAKIKFSVATNLLKENFRYLAGNEKLKRAKELLFPCVIVVNIEDESGWQTQDAAIIKIAYQRI